MRKLKHPEGTPPVPESSVADVSGKLVEALEKGDTEARVSAARAAVFDSANAPQERPMPPPMRRLVETTFDRTIDFVAEKARLEDLLDSSGKTGRQAESLEKAETHARAAFQLLLDFRDMHFTWEMDNGVIFAAMWSEAQKALQDEKDAGKRNKTITDADTKAMCLSMFPDEFRAQEIRRHRAKSTEKSLDHLVEMWSSKCRSLNALVGKGR